MAVIRYHRYVGELWDDLDLDELVDELSDFFLESGFGREMEDWGGDDLQALHDAILEALLRRGLLSADQLETSDGRPGGPRPVPAEGGREARARGLPAGERGPALRRPHGRRGGAGGTAGPVRAHREDRRLPRLPRPARPARLGGEGLLRPPRHARPRDRRRGLGPLQGVGVRGHDEPRRLRHPPQRDRPRGAQGPARRGLRRPAGAPVGVPVVVRHRGAPRLLAQHDPLRRGPLHPREEGRPRPRRTCCARSTPGTA